MSDQTEEVKTPDVLELTVGGKDYRLGRIGFLAKLAAEVEIRKERRREFRELVESLEGLDGELARRSITSAFDHHVRNVAVMPYEIYEWFNTASGELFAVKRSLMNVNPQMKDEEAVESAKVLLDGLDEAGRKNVAVFLARVLMGA